MHTIAFIHDLAIIMLTAGVVTVVFHLLRQPVVLGYIAAGVLIGPHTPPYSLVTDEETIRTLGELGVVFLLFSLGLEFNVKRLRSVGATALIAALAGIVMMLWLGYEVGLAFGWHTMDAVFLGAMLSISSTTITIKALEDLGLRREAFAQTVFAILIVEDVLAIADTSAVAPTWRRWRSENSSPSENSRATRPSSASVRIVSSSVTSVYGGVCGPMMTPATM